MAAAAGVGLWLSASLPNDGCDDICDTPALRGLLAGCAAAAVQVPVVVVAGITLLTRRRRQRRHIDTATGSAPR
jgi:hypothetical protein